MMIKNLKVVERVLEVSLAFTIVTTFAGCTSQPVKTQIVMEENIPDDPNITTYKDIDLYDYYIICLDDVKYGESIYIVKRPILTDRDEYGNGCYEYYYEEINEDHVMGSVYIDKNRDKVLTRLGPDIKFAIRLTDYLEYYDNKQPDDNIIRAYYDEVAMDAIYQKARNDYEKNGLKKLEKEKVYIKGKN